MAARGLEEEVVEERRNMMEFLLYVNSCTKCFAWIIYSLNRRVILWSR